VEQGGRVFLRNEKNVLKNDKGLDKELLNQALTKLVTTIVMLSALIFVSAGTLRFWNGWLFIGTFTVALLSFGAYLYTHNKALLRKRLMSKEKEKVQGAYNVLSSLGLLGVFVLSGLDYRLEWSEISWAVVFVALIIVLAGYAISVIAMIQNEFASRIIEVQEEQKVIDTGIYAMIRHPMYISSLIMFTATSVVLGSYYGMIPMVLYLVGIILRIRNEEEVLKNGLPGYKEYMIKVKYRLVPFLW